MTDVRVRRLEADGAGDVAHLFALYRQFYGKPYDLATAADFLRDRLRQRQSVVLAADLPGSPAVGFTQLYPGFSSVEAVAAWLLNDLFVLESARGHGVAAALMEEAERLAREAGAVSLALETARDNRQAQRLYARQGYEVEDGYLHYEKRLR